MNILIEDMLGKHIVNTDNVSLIKELPSAPKLHKRVEILFIDGTKQMLIGKVIDDVIAVYNKYELLKT